MHRRGARGVFCAPAPDRRTGAFLLGGIGNAKPHRASMPQQPLPGVGFGGVRGGMSHGRRLEHSKNGRNSRNGRNKNRKPSSDAALRGADCSDLCSEQVGTINISRNTHRSRRKRIPIQAWRKLRPAPTSPGCCVLSGGTFSMKMHCESWTARKMQQETPVTLRPVQ